MLTDDGDTLYAKMMRYHSAETGYATVRSNTKISTASHCQVYVSFTPCAPLGSQVGRGFTCTCASTVTACHDQRFCPKVSLPVTMH